MRPFYEYAYSRSLLKISIKALRANLPEPRQSMNFEILSHSSVVIRNLLSERDSLNVYVVK